jgi:hypothetical protein
MRCSEGPLFCVCVCARAHVRSLVKQVLVTDYMYFFQLFLYLKVVCFVTG